MTTPKTLYQKIWDSHVVHEEPGLPAGAGQPALLYIDRHLVHEGTSPPASAPRGAKSAAPISLSRSWTTPSPPPTALFPSSTLTRACNSRRSRKIAANPACASLTC